MRGTQGGEGLESYEIVEDEEGGGVVGTIKVTVTVRPPNFLKPFEFLRILCSHRFPKIPVDLAIREIDFV
jgi:hypothetical protein